MRARAHPSREGHAAKQPRDSIGLRWSEYLSAPVDGASLAVFRMCFGVLMLVEAVRYLSSGAVWEAYIRPQFLFVYVPFIDRWPGNGMYWHFGVLGLLGVIIAVGWHYRLATGVFCIAFTYVFLLEKAQYLNHLYLVCLLSFVLFLVPAHRCWSVDAWRRTGAWDGLVPRWGLLALKFHVAFVYFYAGIAKMNVDWLRGEPQRLWLATKTEFPLFGPYLSQEWCVWLVTYGGLAIDLSIGFLLFWRRTFPVAAVIAFAFHMSNAYLFNIGIFPLLMMATIGLFAPPDWPRTYAAELRHHLPRVTGWGRKVRGVVERWMAPGTEKCMANARMDRWTVAVLHVYMAVQLLLPWRHWLYPGNVHWTEEGHRFSWHMMLRHKDVDLTIYLTDPRTNQRAPVELEAILTERQRRKMPSRPDMLHQFARYLANQYEAEHGVRPQIHVVARASLNRRPVQFLVDPHVDLAAEPPTWRPKKWIVPLVES